MGFSARILTVLALICLFLPAAVFAASDNIYISKMPNGMKLIVREGREINLAAVDIWVKAGTVNETDDNHGISHLVEHMIFKASGRYGSGMIDREMEGIGAELNGGTSKDWVHFYTTVASEYLPKALDVFGDAISNPLFRPEDIEKERRVVLDEIARSESDYSLHSLNLFYKTLYTIHPYRLSQTGTRDSVIRLTRDDLIEYYMRYYRPENICIVVAGDVNKSEVYDYVQSAFKGLNDKQSVAAATISPELPIEPAITSPRIQRYKSSSNHAYITLGYQASSASNLREVCALDVILAIFGDTNRGRVSFALKRAGVRYVSINTDFISQRYPGAFSVQVAVQPEDIDKAISVLLEEFRKLSSATIPPGELSHAIRLVQGGDLFEQETFSGQARALGLYDMISSADYALKYAPTVGTITESEVRSVARKYFGDSNYCLVIVEPEALHK